MKTLNIPGTDLSPSQICLGTSEFNARIPADEAYALLDAFIENGGNFLDTAHVYADWIPGTKSSSEKFLGQWLRQTGLRRQIVLATKGAHPFLATMNTPRMSPAEIAADLNESLEYLQTDTIDLYWLHRDDPSRPVGEILEALNEHVRAGRIRCFGCSNWRISRIQEVLDYAKAHGLQGFVANQPMWSLAVPNLAEWPDQTIVALDDEGVAFHKRTQMALIPFSSQARGFFTKLAAGKTLADSERRLYHNEANLRRLERATTLAKRYAVSVTEIVLSYALSQPFPVFPIVGCRTIEQLNDSLKAANLTLTAEDVAYLVA